MSGPSITDQIAAKRTEILHYEGVLQRYHDSPASGRWYDQGARRMAELKAELAALELEERHAKWELTGEYDDQA